MPRSNAGKLILPRPISERAGRCETKTCSKTSGAESVGGLQWAVGSVQWAVVSGQLSVDRRQWTVVSRHGQSKVVETGQH